MTRFSLPPIYPITDVRLSVLSHADQVRQLAAAGAQIVQLREKAASPREFYPAAVEAKAVALWHGVKLIINDRVDIAHALGADGVHLGQTDMPPRLARKVLGSSSIIGISTHTIEQVREAVDEPVDYIAFGPIFPTSTKVNPDAVVGLELLAQVKGLIAPLPLVAIGGITRRNARQVLDAGGDSVAVISDILQGPASTEDNFRSFCDAMENIVE